MCLFCKIISGEIPSTVVYEDDHVFCFKDIHPVAPVHVLIVPKTHFEDILSLTESSEGRKAYEDILMALPEIVDITGCSDGFRFINNCREDGGQSVMHVHFHLIGGRKLGEKIL